MQGRYRCYCACIKALWCGSYTYTSDRTTFSRWIRPYLRCNDYIWCSNGFVPPSYHTPSSDKYSRWTQLWWCACTLAALCIYMSRLGSFIQGQLQIHRPFRGKSCLSRNRNPVYFFGLGMLLWCLFCCCVATNHICVALTMNIIADLLIVTRIPPHLRSATIFLARQRGPARWSPIS